MTAIGGLFACLLEKSNCSDVYFLCIALTFIRFFKGVHQNSQDLVLGDPRRPSQCCKSSTLDKMPSGKSFNLLFRLALFFFSKMFRHAFPIVYSTITSSLAALGRSETSEQKIFLCILSEYTVSAPIECHSWSERHLEQKATFLPKNARFQGKNGQNSNIAPP